jgi:hypothetical protein
MKLHTLAMLVLVPLLVLGSHATVIAHTTPIPTSEAWLVSSARIPSVASGMAANSKSSFGGLALGPGGNQGSNSSTANVPSACGTDPRVTPAEAEQIVTTTTSDTTSAFPPITASSSDLPPPSPWSKPQTEPCWTSPDCSATLTEMIYCYNVSGNLTEPNSRDGHSHSRQSDIYQACLCDGRMYREYAVSLTRTPFAHH